MIDHLNQLPRSAPWERRQKQPAGSDSRTRIQDPYGYLPMLKNMGKALLPIEEHRNLASIAYGTGLTMLEIQGTIRAIFC